MEFNSASKGLTFKNRASYIYIGREYRYPPNVAFYLFFLTNICTEYFKHAAHSPFFSSKCRLFHNATIFGSCIIHILYRGVLNLNVKLQWQKVNIWDVVWYKYATISYKLQPTSYNVSWFYLFLQTPWACVKINKFKELCILLAVISKYIKK
jgi:hypothetical protein